MRMQFSEIPKQWPVLERAIVQRVKEKFNISSQVVVVENLDDIVSTGAFVSWKAARIVDNRREKNHEEQVAAEMSKNRGIDR